MTKYNFDSPIHKVSSLILAFIILSFCVLPSFAKADGVVPSPSYPPIHPNVPVGWKDGDKLRDILLVVLNDWGITFSSLGADLLSHFDSLFEEFLAVSNEYAYEFWADVKYGANEIGNLILDFTGVNRIRQFANWLINKYNLTNNSSVDVSEASTGSFVQIPYYSGTDAMGVYNHGLTYYYNSDNLPVKVTTTFNTAPVFTLWYSDSLQAHGGGRMVFSTEPGAVAILYNAPTSDYVFAQTRVMNNRIGSFYVFDSGYGYESFDSLANISFPVFSSRDEAISVLLSASSPIVINTDVISIPTDNDITPNDGIEIEIPGTNWGDSIFTILDLIERLIGLYDSTQLNVNTVIELLTTLMQGLVTPTTVDNIPGGVIMDYDEYDIPIEHEWGLFDIFYNTDGEDISILSPWQQLTSIIYGFPAPVLSLFALVVLFVVAYGFIRMGRDSH